MRSGAGPGDRPGARARPDAAGVRPLSGAEARHARQHRAAAPVRPRRGGGDLRGGGRAGGRSLLARGAERGARGRRGRQRRPGLRGDGGRHVPGGARPLPRHLGLPVAAGRRGGPGRPRRRRPVRRLPAGLRPPRGRRLPPRVPRRRRRRVYRLHDAGERLRRIRVPEHGDRHPHPLQPRVLSRRAGRLPGVDERGPLGGNGGLGHRTVRPLPGRPGGVRRLVPGGPGAHARPGAGGPGGRIHLRLGAVLRVPGAVARRGRGARALRVVEPGRAVAGDAGQGAGARGRRAARRGAGALLQPQPLHRRAGREPGTGTAGRSCSARRR